MESVYSENIALVVFWARRYASHCTERADIDFADLVQAGFLGVLYALDSYDAGRGAWSTWASMNIRNAIQRAIGLRRKDAPRVLSLDAPAYNDDDCDVSLGETIADPNLPETDEAMLQAEAAREIRRAVDGLPEDQRKVIQGLFFDGLSHADVAKQTGIKNTNVGHVRSKALLSLSRQKELKAVSLCESLTYISRKSVAAFDRDLTSDTEGLAMLHIKHLNKRKTQQKGN